MSSVLSPASFSSESFPVSCKTADLCDWVVREIGGKRMASLRTRLHNQTYKLITFCSGSESPAVTTMGLAAALRRVGIAFNVEHVASCDASVVVQRWIHRNFPNVKKIFCDMREMGQERAMCCLAQGEVLVDDCDILVAGIVCKAFSSYNKKAKMESAALAGGRLEDAGASGITLQGLRDYLARHRSVKIVIIENVAGLLRRTVNGRPYDKVKEIVEAHGFSMHFARLNSHNFCLPQHRDRVYLWGVRGGSPDAHLEICDMLASLRRQRVFEHDELPTHRPRLNLLARPKQYSVGTKWMARHSAFKSKHGLKVVPVPKPPLAPRIADCIDLTMARLRQNGVDVVGRTIYIDAGQNIHRIPVSLDISPCLVPNAYVYVNKLGRCLTGADMLAYQGIDVDDFIAWREFSEAMLRSLAGNAFSAPVFMCVLLSVLACT
jgi:site-specific DNA-cytosine methylase